jgi:hypothetical protein
MFRLVKKFEEFLHENNESGINIESLNNNVKILLDKFESLIEVDDCLIYSFSEKKSYDFFIMRNNSEMHKDFKSTGFLKKPKIRNGFIYECGYENFENFIKYNLAIGNLVSISLTTKMSNRFKKLYCFSIYPTQYSTIEIVQCNASEVFDIFTSINGSSDDILPDKDYLYCGKEVDDIICGFDYL